MKSFICALTLLTIPSSFNNDETYPKGVNIRIGLDIIFLNSKGENLLQNETTEHYIFEDMKLFFLRSGKEEEVYIPNLNYPKGLRLITENQVRLNVSADVGYEPDIISITEKISTGRSVAFLKINNKLTDTIKTEWIITSQSKLITKAWCNEMLVYNTKTGLNGIKYGHGFTIVRK